MIHLGANADPFAYLMIMVAGHMSHDDFSAGQAQRVEELGTTECLANDRGFDWGTIIVDDVVCAKQDIAMAAGIGAG